MPQKNLAVELLRKLIHGEIKIRRRKSIVQYRRFSEMLKETVRRYHNRAIETVEVIEELAELTREVRGQTAVEKPSASQRRIRLLRNPEGKR